MQRYDTSVAKHGAPDSSPKRSIPGEFILGKRTISALAGTDLEARLGQSHQNLLVIAGVVTNDSIEATVRAVLRAAG
jgi:nicotinamidase-related amidase